MPPRISLRTGNDAGIGDHNMRSFVIAASALLAFATQALVVGVVATTL